MWGQNRDTHDHRAPPHASGNQSRPSALWGPNGSLRTDQKNHEPYDSRGQNPGYFGRIDDPNYAPNYGRPATNIPQTSAGRVIVPGLWAGNEQSAPKQNVYDGAPYQSGKNGHWGDQYSKDRIIPDTRTEVPKPVLAPTPLIDQASPYRGYHPEPRTTVDKDPSYRVDDYNGYQGLIDIRNPREPGTKR